ncbi:MAG: molybdenum cofactor biosynthesis protein [Anaerolineae bacterium]
MDEIIAVRVRAFAGLRETLGTAALTVTVPRGTDVAGLLARLAADYPYARLGGRRFTVAVNRAYAPLDRVLADGDEVGLIPPVSGGADRSDPSVRVPAGAAGRRYEITEQPISLDQVAARVAAPEHGGITLFAGTVRGITRPGQADQVQTDYLEYEAYPEMAEASFAQIAAEAQARWPAISAVAVVHRVGRLEVGETAVVIAVAAAHRANTFDACRYIIDRIKQIAPIWKKEVGPDGTSWVEGPESAV